MTGTDTGVGKTHVTAALLTALRQRGYPAAGFKPIACGADGRQDAARYRELMERAESLTELNPIYLRRPLAPSVAARLERRRLDLAKVFQAYARLAARYQPVLVEGAGGLLVPIRRGYLIADLVRELDLPLLIVARLSLGTLNHTLLTVHAARAAGLRIAGLILNDTAGRPRGLAERTNLVELPRLAKVPLLGVMPHRRPIPRQLVEAVCRRLA